MPLEKACIKVLESCNAGGISFNENDKIYFQFNPEKYSVAAGPNYTFAAKDGRLFAQYTGENPRTLTIELFFDSILAAETNGKGLPAKQDIEEIMDNAATVSGHANRILALTKAGKEKGAPPMVEFMWGGMTVKGVIASASLSYTLFNIKGEPIRATIQLTFKECDDVVKSSSTGQLKAVSPGMPGAAGVSLPEGAAEAELMEAVIKALKLL